LKKRTFALFFYFIPYLKNVYLCQKFELMDVVKFNQIEEKIIMLRDVPVLLDSDVAEHYGVETKEINQALKNKPSKFSESYVMETNLEEKIELVENFDRFNRLDKRKFAYRTAGAPLCITVCKRSAAYGQSNTRMLKSPAWGDINKTNYN